MFTVTRSADSGNDLHHNLQRLINLYEKYIRQYPHEFLWTYKIYKYSKEREVLIISDGKTGHLRQSEGAAKLIIQQLAVRGIRARLIMREVKFRSTLSGYFLGWMAKFSGKYQGHGCGMRYLRHALNPKSWQELMNSRPDIVISAGSSTGVVNYLLAKENQAKSVVLMRPGNLSLRKINLVIIPRHDKPPKRSNVVITEGALNLIDKEYLIQRTKSLEQSGLLQGRLLNSCIGVLIGGNSKKFSLSPEAVVGLIKEIKKSAEDLDADILISTSRRSSLEVEEVIKNEFANYARCKLLVIARQNSNPDVVGGILGLSSVIVISPDSISMVSEAVSAEKYVVVFKSDNLSAKHQNFLKNYQNKKYIYMEQAKNLSLRINQLLQDKPQINSPKDKI
ncbi:MAG: ELM1/GtrOC1 family putative glycosyltransferase [Candidatus Omnitrophica bacterium]|nr:ELM1/GtrOC1 family putative glycosyltransferase [Candidatus Omnitrophota bacterium]